MREGHIPLIGAHRLLPPDMVLSRNDNRLLGGIGSGKFKGVKSSKMWFDTNRIMELLDMKHLAKHPLHKIAYRIVKDLQLPGL